ncbi:MAG TPA: hypothetical protein VGP62_23180 [Bryobacteraceae bacterium]|nr:hypothetical protein [Bryobacteraceae bacterium]
MAGYVHTFVPPGWLLKSWESANRHGLDKLTAKEINAEIAASRRQRHGRKAVSKLIDGPYSG